jgi:hypothetical protein
MYLFGVELTWGETIYFVNPEFITNHFDSQSLSPEGNDSCAIFVGMVHSGSPSLHAILEESASEDDSASSDEERSDFPIPQDCNVVTPAIPVATTPPPEETLVLQTIPAVHQQNAVPQLDIRLLLEQLLAYQEEWQCGLQVDIECGATQQQGKLASKRATVEAQLAKLHQRKSTLKAERAAVINREERQLPTFSRASQNVAAAAALLNTLPASSTDGVDKVY